MNDKTKKAPEALPLDEDVLPPPQEGPMLDQGARYLIEVDYENSDAWGVGVVPGFRPGKAATREEIAQVLELVAALMRRENVGDGLPVRYVAGTEIAQTVSHPPTDQASGSREGDKP